MTPTAVSGATHKPGSPLRILQVASGDLWAGAEKQLYVLACALRRQGVDVSAAVMNPGPLAERLQEAGIPVLCFDESRQSSREIFRALRAHLRQLRPDVVHTHRTKENILAGLAAASLGIPSIRTQHGAQEHPASLLDLRRQILTQADWLVGRFLQRRIVAVSPVLEAELARYFGRARIAQIPNGLDVNGATPERHWGPKPVWIIGIVGRQVPVKRVDLFLEMAKRLEELVPDQGFHFQVIGDGPLWKDHQALARQLGFLNPVEFTGHIDNAEEAIAKLDLLVICSDHEGLPMVALEAMRAGTVIATHFIGALPALLDGGKAGVLAMHHSADSFAEALQGIIANPALPAELSGRAYECLAQRYSGSSMAARYADLYQQEAERTHAAFRHGQQ